MGLRAIERIKGVHHTSIINWVKQVGELLPNAYAPETIPMVGELDELEPTSSRLDRKKVILDKVDLKYQK